MTITFSKVIKGSGIFNPKFLATKSAANPSNTKRFCETTIGLQIVPYVSYISIILWYFFDPLNGRSEVINVYTA